MNAKNCDNGEEAQTEEYSAETHEIEVVDTPKYSADLEDMAVGFTHEEIKAIQNEYNTAVEESAKLELTQATMPHTIRSNGLTGNIHELQVDFVSDWLDGMEHEIESVNGRTFEDFAEIYAEDRVGDIEYEEDPDGWLDAFCDEFAEVAGLYSYKFRAVEVAE